MTITQPDLGSLHSADHLVSRAEVEQIARSASNFMREVYTSLTCRMSTYDYLGLYHDAACATPVAQNYASLLPIHHVEEYGRVYYGPIRSSEGGMNHTSNYIDRIKKASLTNYAQLHPTWLRQGMVRCPVKDRENRRFKIIKLFSQSARETSYLTAPLRELHDMMQEHQPCFRGDLNTQDMHAKLNMNAAIALWTEIVDGNVVPDVIRALRAVSLASRTDDNLRMLIWILPEYTVFLMATMYDAGSIEDGVFRRDTPLIWQRELVMNRFSELLVERAGILRRLMNTSEKYHSMKKLTMKLRDA